MDKLFSCLFGSALYGTRTPTSDRDEKHVVLPSLDDLLMGIKINNIVIKTNEAKNTRNTADDVDQEFIPIQIFARDFMMGQTYAIELAFAIESDHAEQTFYPFNDNAGWHKATGDAKHHPFYAFTRELREKFLTSNIKAMMGYVVNQASLYSFKGERLNVSRELFDLLDNLKRDNDEIDTSKGTLGASFDGNTVFRKQVEALAVKFPKYLKVAEYDIGGSRMKPCLVLLEKTLPFTNTLDQTAKVVYTLISKYGSRANAASESNVDWKATMHALRIVDEGLQLLETHKLSFPFEPDYVAKLLSIKRGEVPLADIAKELSEKLDRLKELEQTTTLPAYGPEMEADFQTWLAAQMRKLYQLTPTTVWSVSNKTFSALFASKEAAEEFIRGLQLGGSQMLWPTPIQVLGST